MTRALDPDVFDVIWTAVEPILPARPENHPLGCHRPRIEDRLCFRGLIIRLVTGSSWVDIEALLDHNVSDTTLRARRNEWTTAGIFDQLRDEAIAAYDRIIGLDLDTVSIDGSLHKAPCGGEGTGPNPTDRGKIGHKWSLGVDANGIPIGWALDGANRNDIPLLEPTLAAIDRLGLLADIGTLCLDGATTTRRSGPCSTGADSASSTFRNVARSRRKGHRTVSRLGCVGLLNQRTRGCRTTGNSDAQPTAEPATATLPCACHRGDHHRPAHRLPRPMEPQLVTYPRMPLSLSRSLLAGYVVVARFSALRSSPWSISGSAIVTWEHLGGCERAFLRSTALVMSLADFGACRWPTPGCW